MSPWRSAHGVQVLHVQMQVQNRRAVLQRNEACGLLRPCSSRLRYCFLLLWPADPAVLCCAAPQHAFLNQSIIPAAGTICDQNSTVVKVEAIQVRQLHVLSALG